LVLSKLRIPAALTLVAGVWLFSLLLVLGRIVAAARQASGQSAEMSASAADQRVTVEEIGAAIGQIDHVTQSNAALVEESVRMADGLNQRARELVSTVLVWKVR